MTKAGPHLVVRRFLLVALAGMLATFPAVTDAQAGTPYWCTCHGKAKRFIGATKGCERTQHVKKCTRSQFQSFVKQACASNGCRPR